MARRCTAGEPQPEQALRRPADELRRIKGPMTGQKSSAAQTSGDSFPTFDP
jgi:hypothetical protein